MKLNTKLTEFINLIFFIMNTNELDKLTGEELIEYVESRKDIKRVGEYYAFVDRTWGNLNLFEKTAFQSKGACEARNKKRAIVCTNNKDF